MTRDQADMLAAEKFWEGVVDEKMQPTQGEIISRRPKELRGTRRIESIEDGMNGVMTYQLSDGRMARFDARAVQKYGIAELMRAEGLEDFLPTERLPVIQYGRRIGTMAPDFDPATARSTSMWYDVRPGDFRREGDTWVAARTLGACDVDCVAGFVRDT